MPASDEPASHPTLPTWWQFASELLNQNCSPVFGCLSIYIAGVYALLALLTLVQLFRIGHSERVCKATKNRMFLGVSCGMCVIRAITIGLYWVPVIASEPIVFDLPALAYFLGYSILVFDFADQYHGEKYKEEADRLSNNDWNLKNYFPWVTSLVCGAWVVLALVKLVASFHAKHPVFLVQVVYAAFIVLISTAAVIAFLVYGCLLLNKRQEFSEEFKRFRNILLIGSINIFGSIFFAIRMWVHGIITVFPDDQRLHPLPVFAFGLILAEIIFAILLLFIFWELPPTYKRLLDRDTADVA